MRLHGTAKFEYLDEIREFVGKIARAGGFGSQDVYDIQLAAYKGVKNGAMTNVMVDYGKAFDASAIPAPDLTADLSEHRIGGHGIFLMRKLMDEVHYEPGREKSNVLTMIKRRGQPHDVQFRKLDDFDRQSTPRAV